MPEVWLLGQRLLGSARPRSRAPPDRQASRDGGRSCTRHRARRPSLFPRSGSPPCCLLARAIAARYEALPSPSVEAILTATGASRSRAYELAARLADAACRRSSARPVGRHARSPGAGARPTSRRAHARRARLRDGAPGLRRSRRRATALRRRLPPLHPRAARAAATSSSRPSHAPSPSRSARSRTGCAIRQRRVDRGAPDSCASDVVARCSRPRRSRPCSTRGRAGKAPSRLLRARPPRPPRALRPSISCAASSRSKGTASRRDATDARPDELALRGSFRTFFPGAQWVGDGMQVPVVVDGQRFVFNLELNVDAYTDAFVGMSVRDNEDSAAVVEALDERRRHDGRAAARALARQQTVQPHARGRRRARRHDPHPRDARAPTEQGPRRGRLRPLLADPSRRSSLDTRASAHDVARSSLTPRRRRLGAHDQPPSAHRSRRTLARRSLLRGRHRRADRPRAPRAARAAPNAKSAHGAPSKRGAGPTSSRSSTTTFARLRLARPRAPPPHRHRGLSAQTPSSTASPSSSASAAPTRFPTASMRATCSAS